MRADRELGTADGHAHRPLDSWVHRELLLGLLRRGRAPALAELASALGEPPERVRDSLLRLDANHGVVLHPGTVEPWVVHPFSTTPTLFFVANAERGWWAPCIWCALGIAALVQGETRISTVLGGETERCEIRHRDGTIAPSGLLAHFPIPVARAWENVHRHCASTLVFADRASIEGWCGRHGVARGEVLELARVAELARAWYGEHLSPTWRKPTLAEARARFERLGLTSAHWRLPDGDERF